MATHPSQEPKYDWQVIQALYFGGMDVKDILRIPRYRNLPKATLNGRLYKEAWHEKRALALAEGAGVIAAPLIQRMMEAQESHQHWILNKLDHEKKVFDKDKNLHKGGDTQLVRLDAIKRIDDTARRTLGLDKAEPVDHQKRNLAILISVQTNGLHKKGESEASPAGQPKEIEDAQVSVIGINGKPIPDEAIELLTQFKNGEFKDEPPVAPGLKEVKRPNFGGE